MSDSSVVCWSRCLSENNTFLFFELLRFRSDTIKATVRVQCDAASHGASEAASHGASEAVITRHQLIRQFVLTVAVESRWVGGKGGKARACLMTWCVVCNYIAFFFNLDLLCDVHIQVHSLKYVV
jgi:hypothetical protein